MRVRWYRIQTKLALREISEYLKKAHFKEGGSEGFVLDRLRASYIEAHFLQKVYRVFDTIDAYGQQNKIELVDYVRNYFQINPSASLIELHNPSRAGTRLFGRLADALNNEFSVEEWSVDPLAWASRFRAIVGVYGAVNKMQIGSIAIAEGAVGQVLVKGSGDVANAAIKFMSQEKYTVEKVQVNFRAARLSIFFQKNASVILSPGIKDEWMIALRDSLRDVQGDTVVDH